MIRLATINDYNRIKDIDFQIHELHRENRPDIFKKASKRVVCTMEYLESMLNEDDTNFYVHETNGFVDGILAVEIKEKGVTLPFLRKQRVYYIHSLGVDEEFRGKGIGKELMNFAFSRAKELKCDSVELNVWSFNSDAIDFYESLDMNVKSIVYEKKLKYNNK